jgi:hypothetical protein
VTPGHHEAAHIAATPFSLPAVYNYNDVDAAQSDLDALEHLPTSTVEQAVTSRLGTA